MKQQYKQLFIITSIAMAFNIECVKANEIERDEAVNLASNALATALAKGDPEPSKFELKNVERRKRSLFVDDEANFFPFILTFESATLPKHTVIVYLRENRSYEIARWKGENPVKFGQLSDSQYKSSDLVGTWVATLGDLENTITFNENGTYKGKVLNNGRLEDEYVGVWGLIGNRIQYCYEECKGLEKGEKDTDWILSLDPDQFVIRTIGAAKRAYRRVK